MDIAATLQVLKELTLNLAAGKKSRLATVVELHQSLNPEEVYSLTESEPQREFISQAFVSLDNLVTEGFATSPAEIQYLAQCFRGERIFSLTEIRTFEVGDYENEGVPPPRVKTVRKPPSKRSGKNN
jgi:hypothetical protein